MTPYEGSRVSLLTATGQVLACRLVPSPMARAAQRPEPQRRTRRIRLVAYGARLESGLGATPREFESLILRTMPPPVAG